ncbi:MAG: hypothetical protein ABFS43_00915 [Thermodesulfobacteriota bacterium]
MRKLKTVCSVLLMAIFLVTISCGGGSSSSETPITGLAVDAGPDQTVALGNTVTLDGSRSSALEGPITYAWSFESKPTGSIAELDDPSAESPVFIADASGTYELSLVISDGEHFSDPDHIIISVKSWKGANLIEAEAGDASGGKVAIAANGDAFAVWEQDDRIYANRFDAASGTWDGAELIDAVDFTPEGPYVAVDPNGNAFAVWAQYDGKSRNLYANRYDADTGSWEVAQEIDAGDYNVRAPRIAVNTSGYAFAVWSESDSSTTNVCASRFDATTGTWGNAEKLESRIEPAYDPRVAVDADGNAFAVWDQSDGANKRIYANRYDSASGMWEGATTIDGGGHDADWSQVAMDADGNAFTVWVQEEGVSYRIYANQYDAASGTWEGAEATGAEGTYISEIDLAMAPNGNVFVVWNLADSSIYADRFDAATGTWDGTKAIGVGGEDAWTPNVAVDAKGNAMVVWYQYDFFDPDYYDNIYANRYYAVSGSWDGAELIDAGNHPTDEDPAIAFGADGNAIAVWSQDDGTNYSIYANRYE